jgi:hypothetical protein
MLVCGAATAAASPLPAGFHVTEQTTTPGGGIATWSESTDVIRPGQPGWVDPSSTTAADILPCSDLSDDQCMQERFLFGADLATSVAGSEAENDTGMAGAEVQGVTEGGTVATSPVSDVAGSYEDATGRTFYDDSLGGACSGVTTTRAAGCGNPYNCFTHTTILHVVYEKGPLPVEWTWHVHVDWCGYERGSITSHSYDDQNFDGRNCTRTGLQRVPLEKINRGHWQEHSKMTVHCELHEGGFNAAEEDDAMAGLHFYSNGTYEEIRRNG